MRARLETLKRITKLYKALEEARLSELQGTMAALHEVQNAVDVETQSKHRALQGGREAIASGDRMGWASADSQHWASGAKRRRLETVHAERRRLNETAHDHYVAGRRKSEQMQRLVAHANQQIAIDEERKAQAATDDRYLAQQRWASISQCAGSTKNVKAS